MDMSSSYLPQRIYAIHLGCKAQGLVAGQLQGCGQTFLGELASIPIGSMVCLVRSAQLLRCIVLLLLLRACKLLLCICAGTHRHKHGLSDRVER